MKQHYLQNERNFWQHSLLSLIEMVHNTSSGKRPYINERSSIDLYKANILLVGVVFCKQQEEAFQKVGEHYQ